MHRIGGNIGSGLKLAAYIAAGASVAAISGALLAFAGSYFSLEVRAAVASVLALAAVLLGSVGLFHRRIPLIQRDRETPRGWLQASAISWALRNGAAIGFGAGTRLGVWLWYVIPFGAFVSGNIVVGVVGYGAYGLARTGGAGLLVIAQNRYRGMPVWRQVLRQSARARRIADAQLLLVGVVVLLVLGV